MGRRSKWGWANAALFGWVAALSGGAAGLVHEGAPAPLLGSPAAFKTRRQWLWLGCGQQDQGYEKAKLAHATLAAAGIQHHWFEMPGAHEWNVWRASLADLAPRLFRSERVASP